MSFFDDEPADKPRPSNTFRQAFRNSAQLKEPLTPAEGCGQVLGVLLFLLGLRPLLFMFIYNVGIDALIAGHQAIGFWAALALSIGYGFLTGALKRR